MAERLLQATVSPRFGTDDSAGDQIILEQSGEWTGQPGFGSIAVREFPVLNGVTRNASVGQILNTGVVKQLTRTEFLQFNGDTASLRYPVDSGTVTFNVVFSFNLDGSTLSPTQLSFRATEGKTEIVANRPFIGALKVQYYTSYRLLSYTPSGYTGTLTTLTLSGDELLRLFGFIISVKGTSSAILEIDPGGVLEGSLRKEVYRVVSTVQVNEVGAWEKSPDFDSGGGWSDGSSPRDGDSIFEYDRPHEIGYLNRIAEGRVEYETVTVFTERGPSSPGAFRADLRLRYHGEGEFEGTAWADSYARLDLGALTDDITSRFTGHNITIS